jgi:hypothetical protein
MEAMDAEIMRCTIATDEANRCCHDRDGNLRPNKEQHAIHYAMYTMVFEAAMKVKLQGTKPQREQIDLLMLYRWNMYWNDVDQVYNRIID